jgi:hypothetical protein
MARQSYQQLSATDIDEIRSRSGWPTSPNTGPVRAGSTSVRRGSGFYLLRLFGIQGCLSTGLGVL